MGKPLTYDRRLLRGVSRDIRDEIVAATERGWSFRRTAKGHVQLRHSNGAIVVAASSCSDRRALRALQGDLRRGEAR